VGRTLDDVGRLLELLDEMSAFLRGHGVSGTPNT